MNPKYVARQTRAERAGYATYGKYEYAERQRRARAQNFASYGIKRRYLREQKKLREQAFQDSILSSFPDAIRYDDYTREQLRAINRLEQYGVNHTELTSAIQGKEGSDFWKAIRPLLERESELARGTS